MFVLGTAGHVDHGKSTLLRQLTGMEPDRLPEEKKRGMTIDLGFVWWQSAKNGRVGIVDVPGHTKFLKSMIAGAALVDAYVFAVAADDGWMPQSEEHLTLLHGLGISRGMVVLTKTDCAGPARQAEVKELVTKRFRSCAMECGPIVDFSLRQPKSIDAVVAQLEALLARLPLPCNSRSPRIWVDRVFVPKGQGVVVTGTLREGAIVKGQEVVIVGNRQRAVVRSIQTYAQEVDSVAANSRVALQLAKVTAAEVSRGDLITGDVDCKTSVVADGLLRAEGRFSPKRMTAVSFQVGTLKIDAQWSSLVTGISDAQVFGRLRFPRAIAIRNFDRFVLRTSGDEKTLGVGTMVDVGACEVKVSRAAAVCRALNGAVDTLAGNIRYHLNQYTVLDGSYLRLGGGGEQPLRAELNNQGLEVLPSIWVDKAAWESALTCLTEVFCKTSSVDEAELLLALKAGQQHPAGDVSRLLNVLLQKGVINRESGQFRLAGDGAAADSDRKLGEALLKRLRDRGCEPMDLTQDLKDGALRSVIQRLSQEKAIYRLIDNHFITAKVYTDFKILTEGLLKAKGQATTSELKELMKLSRKYGVMILERFDSDRITFLKDGVRRLLK